MQTVSEPEVDDEATTANTTTTVDQVEVYGLGIFVSDVASIDLQSSTWYGDVDVYVLKYYRPFLELDSALKEATRPTDRGRACDVDSSDKWLFFKNEDLPELQFVNIGKNPSKNAIVQDDRFDHLRVQSEFYFSPSIAEYPFQTQTLPITLELPPELSAGAPSKVLCLLETYSGFATKLSSFASVDEKDATCPPKVVVDEAARRPPFSRNCEAQLSYPSSGCPPTRQTSRLSLELKFAPPSRLGAFVLLPPSFIALFAIVSYAQSNAGLRLVYHVTLMLAAVTQHAAIRSALPPRAPTTAADDFAFCVYAVVAVAVLAAVAEMLAPKVRMDCRRRRDRPRAQASLLDLRPRARRRSASTTRAPPSRPRFFRRRHRACFHACSSSVGPRRSPARGGCCTSRAATRAAPTPAWARRTSGGSPLYKKTFLMMTTTRRTSRRSPRQLPFGSGTSRWWSAGGNLYSF